MGFRIHVNTTTTDLQTWLDPAPLEMHCKKKFVSKKFVSLFVQQCSIGIGVVSNFQFVTIINRDDGQRNCPKHVEFYSKNKIEKLLHQIGFIIRSCI